MSLFPMIEPQIAENPGARGLYVEASWDFDNGMPVYRNGNPVMVTGKDAVLVWARHALLTPRFLHEIFTWDYGSEIDSLIGKQITDELKKLEMPRLIKEALLINPYITGVENITVETDGDRMKAGCTVITVYGEVDLNV